jgi:hypothetical protein
MIEWLRLATRPSVARRALAYAVGVGAVLIAINHGDAILRGDVTVARVLRMVLTVCVPYLVSTASSVGAMRSLARTSGAPTGKEAARDGTPLQT